MLWTRFRRMVVGVRKTGGTRAPTLDPSVAAGSRSAAYHKILAAQRPLESLAVVVGPDELDDMYRDLSNAVGAASVTAFVLSELPVQELSRPPWRVHAVTSSPELHLLMASFGPFDVVVEHGSTGREEKWRLLRWLLGHVRPDGVYIVDDLESVWTDESESERAAHDVVEFACRLAMASGGVQGAAAALGALDRELAGTIDGVQVSGGLLVVRRVGEVSIKVRHNELDGILRRRDGPRWSRVLRKVPPVEVVSGAIGYTNDSERSAKRHPDPLHIPRLRIREYDDVVALPAGLLLRDNMILPDSYRMWLFPMQSRTRLHDTAHYFARAPVVPHPARLPGQYYYLDLEFPLHFGHFMTEGLGRLWGWPEAKQANPDLKLLVSDYAPYQAEVLAAFGISRSDIVTFEGAVRVDSLIAAMPGFHIGKYVSPEVNNTYRRLQQGVARVPGPGHERVFLARERGLWRECVNAAELEEFFRERGFTVLRPEQFTIPEQAAIFREARVVAGYLGSQLYGQIFSGHPLDVIAFVGPSYTSNNEYLLATALGHTLHQFWCPEEPATRELDVTGRPIIDMHRDYRFDFERDGKALEDLVERLCAAPSRASRSGRAKS